MPKPSSANARTYFTDRSRRRARLSNAVHDVNPSDFAQQEWAALTAKMVALAGMANGRAAKGDFE